MVDDCLYFLHNPLEQSKGPNHHHACIHPSNATCRCGFNSADDAAVCPLFMNRNMFYKVARIRVPGVSIRNPFLEE